MRSASVITAGLATHPQSDKQRLRVMVDAAYESGGIRCNTTDVWTDPVAPVPVFGEVIQWGTNHVWIRGIRHRKMEWDSPTDAPLR